MVRRQKTFGIKLRSHLQLIYLFFRLFPALTFASFAPGQDPEGNVTIVGDVDKFGISDHPKLGTAIIQSLVFDGFSHVHLKKNMGSLPSGELTQQLNMAHRNS